VIVKPGDTMTSIAQQRGVGVQHLIDANPQIKDLNLIYSGDRVRMPKGDAPGAGPAAGDGFKAAPSGQKPVDLSGQRSNGAALDTARSLIGRGYGDINSATPVGRDSPVMNCAQFVNAVYPDLPSGAPALTAMSTPGAQPRAGDVICSHSPPPYGHVGIVTGQGSVIHSTPGQGVHESPLSEFTASSPIDGIIPR
jgi:cell wall-associated NlpC family hydrolase